VPGIGATVIQPTCTVATGSFTISNYNAANTYNVSPSTGVAISATGEVTAPTGTYIITASASNGGCTSGASISVTINAQPVTPVAPVIDPIITQPTCSVATGSFIISNYNAAFTYTISPFTVISISPTGEVTVPTGTYTLTATSNGCPSIASGIITIDAQPNTPAVPTILGNITQPTCSVATGSFAITNFDTNATYTFNPSASVTIDATGIVTAPAGTYTITAAANGCTSGSSGSVTIDVQPTNPIETVNSADADCNNDNVVTFNLNNYIPSGIPTTGTWTDIDNTGGLIGNDFSPYLVNVGIYTFRYEVLDGDCTKIVELNMTVDDNCPVLPACSPLTNGDEGDVHNGFSPNGDDVNEKFVIDRINQFECFPTNSVEIYNRWGILVYETRQYDNETRVFTGTSEGRVTVDKSSQLPTGTYFYVINYTDTDGNNHHLEGYVYLTR
jgi:gliding motility-associated-like protein